jgi:hypothetical protein
MIASVTFTRYQMFIIRQLENELVSDNVRS